LTPFACGRVTAENLERGMKTFAGLRMKLNHFHKLIDGTRNWNTAEEDRMPIRPEWTTVDRVLDMRFDNSSSLLFEIRTITFVRFTPRALLCSSRKCIV
jgi:hypothetical protein